MYTTYYPRPPDNRLSNALRGLGALLSQYYSQKMAREHEDRLRSEDIANRQALLDKEHQYRLDEETARQKAEHNANFTTMNVPMFSGGGDVMGSQPQEVSRSLMDQILLAQWKRDNPEYPGVQTDAGIISADRAYLYPPFSTDLAALRAAHAGSDRAPDVPPDFMAGQRAYGGGQIPEDFPATTYKDEASGGALRIPGVDLITTDAEVANVLGLDREIAAQAGNKWQRGVDMNARYQNAYDAVLPPVAPERMASVEDAIARAIGSPIRTSATGASVVGEAAHYRYNPFMMIKGKLPIERVPDQMVSMHELLRTQEKIRASVRDAMRDGKITDKEIGRIAKEQKWSRDDLMAFLQVMRQVEQQTGNLTPNPEAAKAAALGSKPGVNRGMSLINAATGGGSM